MTDGLDGYVSAKSLTFRYWDADEDEEIGQVQVRTAGVSNNIDKSVWVGILDFDGPAKKAIIPEEFVLGPIYPNPFNSLTRIQYSLPETQNVVLQVYDIQGSHVKTIFRGYQGSGIYTISFDGSILPSGIYLVTLRSEAHFDVKKMEVLR